MEGIKILNKVKEYMEKILKEDIPYISGKKNLLNETEWKVFYHQYKESLFQNARIIYESLIDSLNEKDFLNRDQIKNISFHSAKNTVDHIDKIFM